jgi:hypothetical protein
MPTKNTTSSQGVPKKNKKSNVKTTKAKQKDRKEHNETVVHETVLEIPNVGQTTKNLNGTKQNSRSGSSKRNSSSGSATRNSSSGSSKRGVGGGEDGLENTLISKFFKYLNDQNNKIVLNVPLPNNVGDAIKKLDPELTDKDTNIIFESSNTKLAAELQNKTIYELIAYHEHNNGIVITYRYITDEDNKNLLNALMRNYGKNKELVQNTMIKNPTNLIESGQMILTKKG